MAMLKIGVTKQSRQIFPNKLLRSVGVASISSSFEQWPRNIESHSWLDYLNNYLTCEREWPHSERVCMQYNLQMFVQNMYTKKIE